MQHILQRRLAQKEARENEASLRSIASISDTNARLKELHVSLRRLFLRAHVYWVDHAVIQFGMYP